MGREIGMKYTIVHTYNKNQLRPFNGDEKYDDMIKRKAAVDLSKLIIAHLNVEAKEINTSESDEAELVNVKFSVNVFSDEELEAYKNAVLVGYEPIDLDAN